MYGYVLWDGALILQVLSEVDDENRVALQGAQARHEMDLYMVEQYNAPRLAHVAWKQRMQAALAETALFVKQLNKYRTHIQNCGRKFTPHQKVQPRLLPASNGFFTP